MLEIPLTKDVILWAWEKSKAVGIINAHRPSPVSTFVGAIGEKIVLDNLGICAEEQSRINYDIKYKGKRVEVKTKTTSVKPKPHYEAVVSESAIKQSCDYYAFLRLKNDLSVAWLCGYVSKFDFLEKAQFIEKGRNLGHRVQTWNQYIMEIQELDDGIKS